jgi:hypothetical protein
MPKRRNESRALSLMSMHRVNSGTVQTKSRPEAALNSTWLIVDQAAIRASFAFRR